MEEELDKNNGRDMTPKLLEEKTWRKYPTETSKQKATYGLFQCQYCGKEFEAKLCDVKRGDTKSCGCQRGKGNITHGLTKHRFYDTWNKMLHRCNIPKGIGYKHYGARGIKVCDEWLDIAIFIKWAEATHPKTEGLSLDRIDNDKGYSPENCTWSDKTTQAINQRMMSNNTSGQNGIGFYLPTNKWAARITVNKVLKHIGYYETIEEAVQARDQYIIDNGLPHKLSTDYNKEI